MTGPGYYANSEPQKPDWLLQYEAEQAKERQRHTLEDNYRALDITVTPGSAEEYAIADAYVKECEQEALLNGGEVRLSEFELIKRLKEAKINKEN